MLIELKNVMVTLGGKTVLHGINLTLQPGQITIIHGHSGSGLSTLLKTAAGIINPSNGQVLYDGIDTVTLVEKKKRRLQTHTGFVFQDIALWANMNLASNLDLPLQAKYPNLDPAERRQRIDAALKHLGFSVNLNLRPVELSLGQQKMLSFLRATIPGPEALMMDEPLTGLDPHWKQVVINRLKELRAEGTTLVFGSHNSDLAASLADQIIELHQGQILLNDKEVPKP